MTSCLSGKLTESTLCLNMPFKTTRSREYNNNNNNNNNNKMDADLAHGASLKSTVFSCSPL